MANHEINEDQDALTRALRMIETGDPVHADVYNALFSVLINNDVFLEKLANKMIQQAMISHVTDCTNPDMVMGADQGPVFTQLIEKVKKQVDVLNTKSQNIVIIRQYSAKITLRSNTYDEFSIPFTIPSGYKFVGIVRAWVTNEEIVTVNAYTKTVSSTDVTMSLFNKSSNAITASSYINLLFLKD